MANMSEVLASIITARQVSPVNYLEFFALSIMRQVSDHGTETKVLERDRELQEKRYQNELRIYNANKRKGYDRTAHIRD